VRAGHAFTTALELIANEIADLFPQISQLVRRAEIWTSGARRADQLVRAHAAVDVKFFVTAVMLQRETGGESCRNS